MRAASVLALYALAGASLKLEDELVDELNRRRLACLVSPIFGLCFGLLMSSGPGQAALALGILLGNLLARKVDAAAHALALIISVLSGLALGLEVPSLAILAATTVAALMDEVGHERFGSLPLFKYRAVLKLTMLLIAIAGLSPWSSFIGLMLFDSVYEVAGATFDRTLSGLARAPGGDG